MDKYTQKIKAIKDLQEELDHRKEVEDKVFRLFSEGKFEEGKALLDTLDDEKAMELAEGDVAAEKEEKAISLFEKGEFVKGRSVLDSMSDKQALGMLKECVEEYGEEQTKKDVYCVMQHIRAINYQSSKGEKDDFALACSVCFMQGKCDFMVWSALEHLEKVDKQYIKCAIKQIEEYRNQHGRKASRTLACTNCKKVGDYNCDLYMPCAIFERIETILLRNMFRGVEVKEKGIPKNPQFKLSPKI